MNVSSDQLESLERGEVVYVDEDRLEYVLILRERYEEMQRLLAEYEALKQRNVEEIDPSFFEFDEI